MCVCVYNTLLVFLICTLDKLHLKIPWKNLYTEPVIVNVKGVYIVAGPDSDNFGISFTFYMYIAFVFK